MSSLIVRIMVINMVAVIIVVHIAVDIGYWTVVHCYSARCTLEERHSGWTKTVVMIEWKDRARH